MASKFKMKLKLTGLEIEIEGAREDIPLLMQNAGAQLAGQLVPAANIAAAKLPQVGLRQPIDAEATVVSDRAPPRRRPTRKPTITTNGGGGNSPSGVIGWVHDPDAWGNPQQAWKGTDKAMWLLYVAKQLNVASEMTSTQIAATFEAQFRSAKAPNKANLNRDLSALAGKAPAKVGSNGPAWFLADAGIKHAESLVIAARGGATAA